MRSPTDRRLPSPGVLALLTGAVLLAAALPAGTVRAQPYALGKDRPNVVKIHGDRTVEAGVLQNYRAQIVYGARAPLEYFWDFGDGSFAEGNNVAHRFEEPGTYEVTLVTRNGRGTSVERFTITVEPSSHPRPATAEAATGDDPPVTRTSSGGAPAAKTRKAAPPSRRPARLPGSPASGIAWSQGGYTWVVATHLVREGAEADVQRFRNAEYQTGLVIDDSGPGSTAYRVVIGQYATEKAALAARASLPQDIPGGVWLLPLDQTTRKP